VLPCGGSWWRFEASSLFERRDGVSMDGLQIGFDCKLLALLSS
jgi:hypothetical protein